MSGERQHPAKTKGAHPGSEAIEKGADGLVLVATGAGGHAGRQSPFALVQETRAWFDGPIALSGSIAHGSSILAAEAMGADFAYIGSAFIATQEAHAQPEYKSAPGAWVAPAGRARSGLAVGFLPQVRPRLQPCWLARLAPAPVSPLHHAPAP